MPGDFAMSEFPLNEGNLDPHITMIQLDEADIAIKLKEISEKP
jgi:hypothetical protein